MKSWPKVKLGKVIMCPYLDLFTLILPPIYHFDPDLTLIVYLYYPIFSFIYLYLPTFT